MIKKEYIRPSVTVFTGVAEPLLQNISTGGTLSDINEDITDTSEEGGIEADSKRFNIWE